MERSGLVDAPPLESFAMKDISDYIDLLERKIIELTEEVDKYKTNERLTELWAKGELEN